MSAFEVIGDSADRKAWLALRRTGIGASDMPAVIGVAPPTWGSPLKLYADKIATDDVLDEDETEAQRWGRILEPHIIAEFSRDLGRPASPQGKLLRSKRWPWMLATLDARQQCDAKPGPGSLEVKATAFRMGDWTEGVPLHVTVQAQQQLAVTGWGWGSVAVLLGGMKLRYADIERDEEVIARLVEAGEEFWQRVVKREPPDPDGSPASRAAIKALYPKDSGATIALGAEFIDLDDERQRLQETKKAAESRIEAIDQQIKAAIGDATFGLLPNRIEFSHKYTERAGYMVKATEYRQLRRSEKWRR